MRPFIFLALAAVAVASPHELRARNIVTDIADEYDFVIVGGGLAGLVLGARLSEDASHTVLVLEAGGNGDEFREQIGKSLPRWRSLLTIRHPWECLLQVTMEDCRRLGLQDRTSNRCR